jgi:nitrile hydratase accessory protein
MSVERVVAGMQLPRANGELVFDAPWQSRAFGLAVALHEQGLYEWGAFSERLGEVIAEREPDEDGSGYYERWLASFEALLLERGVVTESEIAARAAAIAGHDDHGHGHDHDHGDHDHGHHHHHH